MNWTLAFTIFGVCSTFALSGVALFRTIKQDRQNMAAKNLDEIFTGNQNLLTNLTNDNNALRKRVGDLETEMSEIKLEKQREIDGLVTERNDLAHQLLKVQGEKAKLITQLGGSNG